MTWKFWTPERDGHAPEGWNGSCEVEIFVGDAWDAITWQPTWHLNARYRYRAKQPDLLAQCLALPQDQREALIEAMQKPQRDWADEVALAYWNSKTCRAGVDGLAEFIRSMCRPKEVELSDAFFAKHRLLVAAAQYRDGDVGAIEAIRQLIREALS